MFEVVLMEFDPESTCLTLNLKASSHSQLLEIDEGSFLRRSELRLTDFSGATSITREKLWPL